MQYFKKLYTPAPGNENENAQDDEKDIAKEKLGVDKDGNPIKEKSIGAKIHDALQEWSNDDARDIEEDDSTPMRSGL